MKYISSQSKEAMMAKKVGRVAVVAIKNLLVR